MEKRVKEKTKLQWHPAFYAGIQIEFADEARNMHFESEHQLGTKPKEIDVLIIVKDYEEPIQKNIGRIFRKHNIVEYKSPTDYLSVDDYYKVHAYADFYKSDTPYEDVIGIEEITISFVCRNYPMKLMTHLINKRHYNIVQYDEGIYYIVGDIFPIQIVVTSELPKECNFWLRNLTDDLKKPEDIEEIAKEYQKHENNKLYDSVMNIIIQANEERFEEVKSMSMCEALRNLFKDELEEGMAIATKQGLENGMRQGAILQLIELVRDNVLSLEEAAKRAKLSKEEFQKKMEEMESDNSVFEIKEMVG